MVSLFFIFKLYINIYKYINNVLICISTYHYMLSIIIYRYNYSFPYQKLAINSVPS